MAGFRDFGGRRRVFATVAVVVLLLGGVWALVPVRGGSAGFDLPSELASSVSDAAAACGADMPWESGCVEAAWVACEEAKSFRRDFLDSEVETGKRISYGLYVTVRALPYQFLCRSAYMAELARLDAVLADRYGSEFWEEVDYEEEGVFDEGSFWWLRDHITFTPWNPSRVYGSISVDVGSPRDPSPELIGPSLGGMGWRYTVGRWLARIREWGYVGSWQRTAVYMLSDETVGLINSLLDSVGSLTEVYDSWPVDVPYDPDRRIEYYPTVRDAVVPTMYNPILESQGYIHPAFPDSDESDSALEVYEVCSSAISAAKFRTADWDNKLEECITAAQDCSAASDDSEILCERIEVLAQEELNWQKLPEVCQSTDNIDKAEDQCELAMREICRYKGPTFLGFLGTIALRRYMSMRVLSCYTLEGPNSLWTSG